MKGWRFVYASDIECPSELPVEMNAFKAQQARWAKGLIQVAKKILPRLLRSNQPLHVKIEGVFHLTANISYPLMILLSTLLLPAMIVRFYQGWFQMLLIDLPLFLASTCSISSFYLVAQRELYPRTWTRTFLYLPFVMACGIGLAVRNSIAVLEALFGKPSEFVRTPKYAVGQAFSLSAQPKAIEVSQLSRPSILPAHAETAPLVRAAAAAAGFAPTVVSTRVAQPAHTQPAHAQPAHAQSARANGFEGFAAATSDDPTRDSGSVAARRAAGRDASWLTKAYRRSAGWTPYVEILLGLYFAVTVFYAIEIENYAPVPFLLLFVGGYLYTGLMSLGQVYLERLRFGLKTPVEARPAATGAPSF